MYATENRPTDMGTGIPHSARAMDESGPRVPCLMECAKQAGENVERLEKLNAAAFDLVGKLHAVLNGEPPGKGIPVDRNAPLGVGLMPSLMKQSMLIDQLGAAIGEIGLRLG